MPPKIYVPFLNIGSVPSAKAQKKPHKHLVISDLCSTFAVDK